MYKQKISGIAVSVLALLAIGCSADMETEKSPTAKKATVTEKTFNDFMLDKTFGKAYSQISGTAVQPGNDITARTAMEEQFGFTISQKKGKMIKIDSIISYTFLIMRANQSTDYFENLIIQVTGKTAASAYIRKYIPSEPIKEYPQHDSFVFKGSTKTQQLRAEIIVPATGDITYTTVCELVGVLMCDWGGTAHEAGSRCENTYYVSTLECVELPTTYIGDGGNSGGGGGTAPGVVTRPGGGTGNGNFENEGPSVITSPVVPSTGTGTDGSDTDALYNSLNNEQQEWASQHWADYLLLLDYYSEHADVETRQLILDMIDSFINETAISLSPFFKYPLGSSYATDYVEFTSILSDFLPYLKDDANLISSIHNLTGMSNADIIENLTWGKGPEVHITQLGLATDGTQVKGLFNPSQPDKVFIDIDLVNYLENFAATNPNNPELYMLRSLVIFSVCLHELVHYADYDFDSLMQDNANLELGELFEATYVGGYYEFDPANHVILIKAH